MRRLAGAEARTACGGVRAVAAAALLLLTGCGSMKDAQLPPPVGPAAAPPLTATPAGRVLPAQERATRRAFVRAGGREFTVDRRASELHVAERGRRIARVPTALEPVALTASDRGRKIAVLAGRARRLELFDAATLRRVGDATAGTGPTRVVSDEGNYLYVADTKGGALLVFRILPELHLQRRYPLTGAPYGLAYDSERNRLWATLTATNELVELAAGARPHELRRFPAVRQPEAVDALIGSDRVLVTGAEQRQLLDPPPLARAR